MRTLAAILLFLPVIHASSAPRPLTIGGDAKSFVAFRIDDTVETINGTTNRVAGTIDLDPENLSRSSVVITVDLRTLDTGVSMRDADMRETLETGKYPLATFKSTVVNGPASLAAGQSVEVRIGGDFSLHGVTRRISVPVRLQIGKSTGQLQASAHFTIRMTDYDIPVPDKLIVSVADEVGIRFEVTATAR